MSTFSDLSMYSELIIQQEISQTKKKLSPASINSQCPLGTQPKELILPGNQATAPPLLSAVWGQPLVLWCISCFPSMVSGTSPAVLGHTNEGQECRSHAFQGWWNQLQFLPSKSSSWDTGGIWGSPSTSRTRAARQPSKEKCWKGGRLEWCDRSQSRAEDHFQKWVSESVLPPLFSQQPFKYHRAGRLSWATVSAQNGTKERVARAEGREMGSETEPETKKKLVSSKNRE